MPKKAQLIRIIFYGVFLLSFAWVSGKLFFEQQTDYLMTSVKDFLSTDVEVDYLDDVKIIYPEEVTTLEPTSILPAVRQRLVNIYEPLVRFDRDMRIESRLALNWGLEGDREWEFKIRPDVKFQDGSSFDVEDVIASIDRARFWQSSELVGLLSNISFVEVVDDQTVRILTERPDPLLLQKLALVLMIPSEHADKAQVPVMGTGPYVLNAWVPGQNMELMAYEDYWGGEPKFESVEILVAPNKVDRVNLLRAKKANLLAFVPFDGVGLLEEEGFLIRSMPSLEVQFLLFNFKSAFSSNLLNRQIVSLAINQQELVERVGGFAKPVSQFVSNGVFGFNPEIERHLSDLDFAVKAVGEAGLSKRTVQVHLPRGLDVLGEAIRENLSKIGLSPVISYLAPQEFFTSLAEAKADIYFLGVKSDLGDAVDFLNVLPFSEGEFNFLSYENARVDELIGLIAEEMDDQQRLKLMQEAMGIVVEDDVFGVPLFEYEVLYAFDEHLDLDVRVDGLIYFDDLILR